MLLDFENLIGNVLPAPYRAYLTGSDQRSLANLIHPDEDGPLDFAVSEMFGLHTEPRLQDNHQPWTFYDLHPWKAMLAAYISIGDTTTGEMILLELAKGSIHLLETDCAEGEAPSVLKLADGFDAFVAKLVTEDDVSIDDDFEKRLADMQAQRERDVQEYLERKNTSD